MPHPIPYLSFNGTCADAMRFYETALKARQLSMMTYGESPMAADVPPEAATFILNAYLEMSDGGVLMAGDNMEGCGKTYEGIKGVAITLNYPTVAEAQQVFDALSENATLTMPMQPAFWAKAWGMLTDRFGTPWIINGEILPYKK